jgi:hypothetical protein
MPATQNLLALTKLYKDYAIEFPALRSITLAQWIVESGWGSSELAKTHNNYAGIKWRKEMSPFASKVVYEASDGKGYYCHFHDKENFIKGYWAFLERSPYNGWREHVSDGEEFISFIGGIWAEDKHYIEKVLNRLSDAEELLGESSGGINIAGGENLGPVCEECGTETEVEKPTVDRWESTSHKSSRNNADIDRIVIHYTTSRNIEGTISHFKTGTPRTSAHYIVGRDGALVQMVLDNERAWHAGNSAMNARSIGIEHVAALGDGITSAQERTSAALIRWLMREYDIKKDDVIPHVCVKPTSCCGDLFEEYGGGAGKSCNEQKEALHKWMTAVGIDDAVA